jgi:hypothetical protein
MTNPATNPPFPCVSSCVSVPHFLQLFFSHNKNLFPIIELNVTFCELYLRHGVPCTSLPRSSISHGLIADHKSAKETLTLSTNDPDGFKPVFLDASHSNLEADLYA